MTEKKRIVSLDGLKGLSAVMVFVGHFLGVWKYAQKIKPLSPALSAALKGYVPVGMIVNESFWLYILLMISGFLLANKQITQFTEIVMESIKRFIRLFIPILFAQFIIVLIQNTFGFYHTQTSRYFISNFIQGTYPITLQFGKVFIYTFKVVLCGYFYYNDPFWMISKLFYSSILIYIACFLINKTHNKKQILVINLGLLSVATFLFGPVGLSCALGFNLYYINRSVLHFSENKIHTLRMGLISAFIFLFTGLYNAIWYKSAPFLNLPNLTYEIEGNIAQITAFVSILLVLITPLLSRIFENKLALSLYKINWGVYCFHWPIICSFSCYFIISFYDKMNSSMLLIASLIVTTIVLIISATIYHLTFEQISDKLLSIVKYFKVKSM